MESDDLRQALARLAAGVSVVATRGDDGYRGLTVTSLTSVSLDPPLVLVSLERLSQTRELIAASGVFCVSVLARSHEFIADRLSGRAPAVHPSWREVPHFLSPTGLPIVHGALAWLDCALEQAHAAGDHDLLVGSVRHAGSGPGDPLVLWDREFWSLG